MKVKKIRSVIAMSLFSSLILVNSRPAHAVELKTGGLIFAQYERVTSHHLKDGTPAQDFNAFDVSRIYINADAKYNDTLSGFINLEADLVSRETKNNRVFLKSAELRWGTDSARIYFGLIGVPWRALEETVWHRFVSKDLEDVEGIGLATDRGIRLSGKIPYLSYHLMMANGEGTGADGLAGNETTAVNGGGKLKDYIAMVSLTPFETLGDSVKGFKISAMVQKGDKNETTLRNRAFAGIAYDSKHIKAVANYYNADNSSTTFASRGEGISLYTIIYPNEKWWILARFDQYNPNIVAGGFSHNRIIYGAGYLITKGVRISLDHQYLHQERRTAALQDESVVSLHTEIKF